MKKGREGSAFRNTMSMKQYLNGIQHLGLPTNDMDKTIAFYESLGFTIPYETRMGEDRVVFLQLGDLVLECYTDTPAVMKNGAIDHLAIDVSDIDAVFAEAKAAGYQIMEDEVQYLPFWEKGVRFFNIVGPNAETVEFSQKLS